MTMPAMAPPESPPLLEWTAVMVTFAPVATGVWKGMVVVGLCVAVTTVTPEEVGRMGAPAMPALVVVVSEPAAAAHWPHLKQYCVPEQQISPHGDSFKA